MAPVRLGTPPRGTHVAGIAIAALGVMFAIVRTWWLPALPKLVPLVLIVTALGLMLVGSVRRVKWGMARRGEP